MQSSPYCATLAAMNPKTAIQYIKSSPWSERQWSRGVHSLSKYVSNNCVLNLIVKTNTSVASL